MVEDLEQEQDLLHSRIVDMVEEMVLAW